MRLTEEQKKIVEENHNLIYSFAHSKKLNLEYWYDILAIELCKSVIKHDPTKATLSTLFYLKANRTVIMEMNKINAKKRMCEQLTTELFPNQIIGTDDDFDNVALNDELVSSKYYPILKLKYEGYSQKEIAEMLDISQSQVSRALKEARRCIE